MNATLILGAVALVGLAAVAMKGGGVQADEPVYFDTAVPMPEITGDEPVGPPPAIITEPPPPAPPGGMYQLVPGGDLAINLVGG
jgi:hypothetical protein